ncbi:MAG: hypothetical protein LBG77_01640 [Dysgonamonadaceae bacterium]|jgi:hypothetical protein|nr:hypothetical protein [Dysgonamonadaceae bacterium]
MYFPKIILLLPCLAVAAVQAVTVPDSISRISRVMHRIAPDTIDTRKSILWNGFARSAAWGRPFWADMHSTLTRVEVAYATNSPDYDWAGDGNSYRPYVFANIGADLPVWTGEFSGGKFGVSLALPFFVDVWLDMFERTTAPVINTAYRFGAFDFGFIHHLEKPFFRVIKNYAVRISPLKHECTHIGDELTIYRINDADMKVTRINVSYNYAEFMLTLNDPAGSIRSNHALRFGFLLLHDFKRGYYDILPQEADEDVVESSHRPWEWYIQWQYQSALMRRNMQVIASMEWRDRERYNYPFSYSGHLQDWLDAHPKLSSRWMLNPTQLCINFFAGLRFNNVVHLGYYSKIGVGFRYYSGINPYGQFRSQPRFNQWGITLMFE